MSEWAIEADDLAKKFVRRKIKQSGVIQPKRAGFLPWGRRAEKEWSVAVDGVSLRIPRGEVFGLLGPNGAGKTTTIRMLCTLLEPTSGSARVNGYDIYKQSNLVRQSLGAVLGGERSIYWKLTARENLAYFAALYHIPPASAKERINELLRRMELTDRADELVEKYSTGMKQRVAISRALLARPPVLLLDEPTLGLDPQAARKVRQLVQELKSEGHTILLTTHYMEEADLLSDRIGIIDQGKIIALDTPANLKQRIRQKDVLHLEVSGWTEEISAALQSLPGVENLSARPDETNTVWNVSLHSPNSRELLPALMENVNRNGSHLVNLNILQPTLEDVFIDLTGKALRD